MDSKLENIRAWLQLRRRELQRDVQSSMEDLKVEGHHLADLEELASDVNADGVIFEQFRTSSESIEQIERALERVESGGYFECEDCEQPIGGERLEAIPFTTRCIGCQRTTETDGPMN